MPISLELKTCMIAIDTNLCVNGHIWDHWDIGRLISYWLFPVIIIIWAFKTHYWSIFYMLSFFIQIPKIVLK